MRMDRLRTRPIRDPLTACWQFDVDDGPSYSVAVEGSSVNVRAGQGEPNSDIAWNISSRDLLALLLGRLPVGAPELATSRPELLESFTRVFPGP